MTTPTGTGVEVKKLDVKKGKGLYAKTHFKEGDEILTEAPLVCAQFSWNEAYKYTACEFCLRSLETAEEMSRRLSDNPALVLPHPECCAVDPLLHTCCPHCQVLQKQDQELEVQFLRDRGNYYSFPDAPDICWVALEDTENLAAPVINVTYCSEACRSAAWERYHRTLCMGASRTDPEHPLSKLQETWRNIHYPPETAGIMLLAKMAAMVKQSGDPGSMLQKFSQFVHTTVNEDEEIVHKLLGKEFQSQLEILHGFATEALCHEHIQQWFTPEGFRSMFALIGTNGQGIGSSSISKWVNNCEKLTLEEENRKQLDTFIDQLYADMDAVSGVFLNCDGSGLYELQSACNHSCVPNAEIGFLHGDHTLTLTALKDIQPEEEICISYLDECDVDRSRHSRQKLLRENYLFNCSCVRCLEQADDPDETSEEEMSEEEEEA